MPPRSAGKPPPTRGSNNPPPQSPTPPPSEAPRRTPSPPHWPIRLLSFLFGLLAVIWARGSLNVDASASSSPPSSSSAQDSSNSSKSQSIPPAAAEAGIYCYQTFRASATSPVERDWCFEVLPGGVFGRVGPADELRATAVEKDVVTIRKGHVLPGLWDAHGHVLQFGEYLHSADLFGSNSIGEVRRRLRRYVDAHPDAGATKESWARGVGWDQMLLLDGKMPTAEMLEEDEVLKGRYWMLDRVDVHCVWVSKAVLGLIPEEKLREDVPGGEIVREPGYGVFCDNAMELVMSLWPRPGKDKRREFVKAAMRELNKVGIVGVHDAGVVPEDVKMLEELVGEGEVTVRVYAMLECPERNTFCGDAAPYIADTESSMLTVRSVKLFGDGALGSWGSAMLEPYADRPDTSGSLLVNASTLSSLAQRWSAAGYQVNIHAIGDLANQLAIDALESALRSLCPDNVNDLKPCQSRHRFRIEHAQIIHPADQLRLAALGIIPSIQPTHATSDMSYAVLRLGKPRLESSAYRMKSLLLNHGLTLALGSDFPVEPPDPFQGIYAAVTRRNPHTGKAPPGFEEGWYREEEGLTLEQALEGFTRGAAWAGFMEDKAGEIGEGRWADWVVLEEEVGGVGEEGWRRVRVVETWVAGRRVFVREEEEGKGREDL
ncbi:hypothetical protein VTJ04DRAFT_9761 [Mycothermus thermophilus]|uniref:uncharacterized protein n=1 Tax=Humicola insolens TaxID=85995 RepID=UPI003742B8D2